MESLYFGISDEARCESRDYQTFVKEVVLGCFFGWNTEAVFKYINRRLDKNIVDAFKACSSMVHIPMFIM